MGRTPPDTPAEDQEEATLKESEPPVVEVRIEIVARPETVFSFLSDPERFRKWVGAESEIVPGRGGSVTVVGPGGPPARGEILEWIENQRVAFSWSHGGAPDQDSRVTIDLVPVPGGTLVTLSHAGIPSEEARRGHEAGWTFFFASLSARAAEEQMRGRLDALADASLAAWTESDPARRESLIEEAWAEDSAFVDPFCSVRGRAALSRHIAGVMRTAPPGTRLVRGGPVEQCHGHVRFAWRAERPDGVAFATGMNFGDLSSDGRFSRVIGFWDPPPSHADTAS
jgi:uncharacterized protein YndB with AHSA1/START domain